MAPISTTTTTSRAGTKRSGLDYEEDDEEEETLGHLRHAETFAEYMPSKLKMGGRHPDPVVETNSLSSVDPPDIWYKLSIPQKVIDDECLSALQLEAIIYACQQHNQFLKNGIRAGYLIGDGAGVGKGRTIAGIIFENYLQGRTRALWISVSNDLKYDAERDLRDIGAGNIKVYSLNKFNYDKISAKTNGSVKKGVIFSTYSILIGECQSESRTRFKQLLNWCGKNFDGVIVFDECHKAKNLHPVGSTKPSKTGLIVLELQKKLPKARVVYASATGASEPKNMAYMTRLGLWGAGAPFKEFSDFIRAVEKRGVGAMELVAMDMKLRGMYIARQLSFAGVSFRIEEIPLTKEFVQVYDDSVQLWVEARKNFQAAAELIEANQPLKRSKASAESNEANQLMKKTMWAQFWLAHQRFFKYLCIANKVKHVVRLTKEAIDDGKCVVIGLQSTGEARTLEQLEQNGGELSDFVSESKGVLQTLIERQFPALCTTQNVRRDITTCCVGTKRKLDRKSEIPAKRFKKDEDESVDFNAVASNSHTKSVRSELDSDGSDSELSPFADGSNNEDGESSNKNKMKRKKKTMSQPVRSKSCLINARKYRRLANMNCKRLLRTLPKNLLKEMCEMKNKLLAKLEILGKNLPPNTLDKLIDELGGPEKVAEMTGRKGRIVSNANGIIQYESRSECDGTLETLNLIEKRKFMDGEKNVAIISEAASSGISLQSDRRAKNQKRRVHITLELPWSADRAVQQFGRTHRSNQVNAPEYLFLISDLAGERRFASTVVKRLESLGALTHGDRRATSTRDLSRFNIDNKYGRSALDFVMKSVMACKAALVPPPKDYKGDFLTDVREALIAVDLDDKLNDHNKISKFLNRILGLKVELQNRLFRYFTDTFNAVVSEAKKSGRFDLGILDLDATNNKLKRIKCVRFCVNHATGNTSVSLNTVIADRGMSWEQAVKKQSVLTGTEDGFYLAQNKRNGKKSAILAVERTMRGNRKRSGNEKLFNVYKPNTGLKTQHKTLTELKKKYTLVKPSQAQSKWKEQYDLAANTCSHVYWQGSCKSVSRGLPCYVGLRTRMCHILDGSVLSVWSKLESILGDETEGNHTKIQVIRLKFEDGQRIIGILIPKNRVKPLTAKLRQDSSNVQIINYT